MKKLFGGRYSVRNVEKRKKNQRSVMSYEDVPLDEYNDKQPEISKEAVKRILIVVAIILALGLVVFAVANRDAFSPDKVSHWFKYDLLGSSDEGYPVSIIGSTINSGNFQSDGDVMYVSDTSFAALSSSGNEIGYNQHGFANPILCTAGENVLIYNLGGNGFVTGTKEKLNKAKDTDYYVLTADINDKGYYCVVTQTDGYLSKIHVFNNNNEKIYSYSFSDYYINSVALNANGTGCVACGVTGDNGSLLGIAYVLDFSQEKPVATHSLEENTIYSVEYFNSNTVCMVGSNSSYTLDIGAAALKQIDYSNMQLTAYDINTDTNTFVLALSRSGDGRTCSIEYINSAGEVLKVNDTNLAIESISLYKNRIAVLDSDVGYLFDTDGNKIGKASAGNGAKALRLGNADEAYILGINEIRRIVQFK